MSTSNDEQHTPKPVKPRQAIEPSARVQHGDPSTWSHRGPRTRDGRVIRDVSSSGRQDLPGVAGPSDDSP